MTGYLIGCGSDFIIAILIYKSLFLRIGLLHIGNYFGMIKRMIHFQESSDLFCFIANYHSLTSLSNKEELEKNTFTSFCDVLALGLDPSKSTIWIQSHVSEVTELAWILSNFTGVGMMERSTSYKDKINKGLKPNMGLFSYPILMASDILLFQSDIVPVGKDQKQHLEMTRDIACLLYTSPSPRD